MGALLVLHPLLRRGWEAVYRPPAHGRSSGASNRLEQRASFDFVFAIIFITILHGLSVFKILGILYINFKIATKLPRNYVPTVTWVFNICTLFANELTNGLRLRNLADLIDEPNGPLVHWGYWIDSYGGILARWEVLFNITILRLISFNLDYYWGIDKGNANSLEVSCSNSHDCRNGSLMCQRRKGWIQQTYLNETGLRFLPSQGTIHSATTSHMRCTHRCIWLGRY